jgi:hypothetical protein
VAEGGHQTPPPEPVQVHGNFRLQSHIPSTRECHVRFPGKSPRKKMCTGGVGDVLFPQESEGEGGAQIEIGIGKEGDAVLE